MRRSSLVLAAFMSLASVLLTVPASAAVSQQQRARLQQLLRAGTKHEQANHPVEAYLFYREAFRLEQLWTNNTFGEKALTPDAMDAFTNRLARGADDHLMKILHSPKVPLNDKLNLLRILEQEVMINYPGPTQDGLLGTVDGGE